MAVLTEIRRRSRHIAGPLLGALAVAYFGYHSLEGERGLFAWWRLRQEIREADDSLAILREQRQVVEHRTSLLRPESLDRDMLEERARLMLNLGLPDEIIILNDAAPGR